MQKYFGLHNYTFNDIILHNILGAQTEPLKERILIVSSISAFTQGLTNQLLYCLTYRDAQTSKQVFQLMLEMKG